MKVLHILNELRPSGAEEMLRIAAPYWIEQGCDLHLLSLADKQGAYTEPLAKADWTIHLSGPYTGGIALFQQIRTLIHNIKPDIVHVHPEAYGIVPVAASRSCGIPTVRTIHNCFAFEAILCHRKRWERYIARRLGVRFISIGETVRFNEQSRFHNPTTLLWNWVDTNRFRPPTPAQRSAARVQLDLPSDRKILVSIGNASDVKNYRVIIESLAKLGNSSLLYCQVGHPHPDDADRQLAEYLGVDDQVRFCGPSNEVTEWLWAADYFLMPSLHEGFSIAALEALAAGCDCIFFDTPGIRDLRAFELQADWTEPNCKAFATALKNRLGKPRKFDDLLNNAKLIQQYFSSQSRVPRYVDFWRSICDAKNDSQDYNRSIR